MTPSNLKASVLANNPKSHFFDRKSMQFAGDTMANYGVRSAVMKSNYDANGMWVGESVGTLYGQSGIEVEVWELYRKRAVKYGLKSSVYFAKDDYRRVYASNE